MKTKKWKYWIAFAGAAALGIGAAAAYGIHLESALLLLSFPFAGLGNVLRSLSLGSEIGNIAACVFYALISVIPLVWFWKKTNHKGRAWILPCMSLWLFYVIYNMVNPGYFIRNHFPGMLQGEEALPVFQLAVSILFYSMWIAYLMCGQAEKMKMHKEHALPDEWAALQLHKILGIAAAGITCFYAYTSVFVIKSIISTGEQDSQWFAEGEVWQPAAVTGDQTLGVIRLVFALIPIVLTVFLIIKGMELLEELGNPGSDYQAERAEELSDYSLRMVYAVLISDFVENSMQFLFCTILSETDFSLNISFFPLILAFSARILAGNFRKSKELQEENDLFI